MKTKPHSTTRAVFAAIVSLCLLALAGPPAVHARPGDLDPTFGTGGKVTTSLGALSEANSIAVQRDGKIVVAGFADNGTSLEFALARYTATGALDTTFNTYGTGKVTTHVGIAGSVGNSVAVQADGKIVVAGNCHTSNDDFALVRYHGDVSTGTTGTLDTSFGIGGIVITPFGTDASANSVAVQSDGKILVAGSVVNGSRNDIALVRYNSNGSLDMSFNGTGKVTPPFSTDSAGKSVAVQSDGKILVAGYAFNPNTSANEFAVVRYHGDVSTGAPGTLDTSFNGNGTLTIPVGTISNAESVAVQNDGKILVAGAAFTGSTFDFALVRCNANGSLDMTFNGTGKVTTAISAAAGDFGQSVAVQADGKILVAGSGGLDIALVRYTAAGTLDASFNGSGKVTTDFGSGPDVGRSVAVQGDGKILVAVVPNNGAITDFALVRYQGVVTRDFNGDGIADLLFQNAVGQIATWFLNSTGTPFGATFLYGAGLGDWRLAAVGDFNNDGFADFIFQNAIGQIVVWYLDGAGATTSAALLYGSGLGDWRVVGAADVNADGNTDLLFQNTLGQIVAWFLNGAGSSTGAAFISTVAIGDWRLVAIADINRDDIADLLFQNTAGQIAVWHLNASGAVAGAAYLSTGALGDWRLAGTADINSDGTVDLLFQNNVGQIVVWYLNTNNLVIGANFLYGFGLGDWRLR